MSQGMSDDEIGAGLNASVRLHKTAKSKNGYHIWINGTPVITKGPITIQRDPDNPRLPLRITVPLAIRPENLIED